MPQNNPLTEQDLEKINDNLAQLDVARTQIQLARQAGIDVSQQEDVERQSRAQLIKLKQTYFPGA